MPAVTDVCRHMLAYVYTAHPFHSRIMACLWSRRRYLCCIQWLSYGWQLPDDCCQVPLYTSNPQPI